MDVDESFTVTNEDLSNQTVSSSLLDEMKRPHSRIEQLKGEEGSNMGGSDFGDDDDEGDTQGGGISFSTLQDNDEGDTVSTTLTSSTSMKAPSKKKGKARKSMYKKRDYRESSLSWASVPDDNLPPETPDKLDLRGEEKVDKDGNLLGNRRFIFRTFSIPRHPTRKYVLVLEAARILGFSNSLYLFEKHPDIPRIMPMYDDRDSLMSRQLISTKNKSRPFALTTARDMFKIFGHKVVHKGKPIRDDYFVGDTPEPEYGEDSETDDEHIDYLAGTAGALGTGLTGGGKSFIPNEALMKELKELKFAYSIPTRPRTGNWLSDLYSSASEYNSLLVRTRRDTFYDSHTGSLLVPTATQPSAIHVQMKRETLNKVEDTMIEDELATAAETQDKKWEDVQVDNEASKYPLAIMDGQWQGQFSIYPERFYNPETNEDGTSSQQQLAAQQQPQAQQPPQLQQQQSMPNMMNFPFPMNMNGGMNMNMSMMNMNMNMNMNMMNMMQGTVPPMPANTNAPVIPTVPVQALNTSSSSSIRAEAIPVTLVGEHLDPRYSHFCGAITRDNKGCRRPVSQFGERCLYHKNYVPPSRNLDRPTPGFGYIPGIEGSMGGMTPPMMSNGLPQISRPNTPPVMSMSSSTTSLMALSHPVQSQSQPQAHQHTQGSQGGIKPGVCVHCNSTVAPTKVPEKEKQKTPKRSPKKNKSANNSPDDKHKQRELSQQQAQYARSAPISNTLVLNCEECHRPHHPTCIDLTDPILVSKVQNYAWHCPDCKLCIHCKEAGDEEMLMFCDLCDRGVHTYCLQPKLDSPPEGTWYCQLCSQCQTCGSKVPNPAQIVETAQEKTTASGRVSRRRVVNPDSESNVNPLEWKHAIIPMMSGFPTNTVGTYLGTYCVECYKDFSDGRMCPCCLRSYPEAAHSSMLQCHRCMRCVHPDCDPDAANLPTGMEYTCPLCTEDRLSKLVNEGMNKTLPDGSVVKQRVKVANYKNRKVIVPLANE